MTQDAKILAGRYEVGDLIGRGGMAEVHIGYDTRLGRTVAIKILRADLARDPSFQTRFRREAQAAAGLNHPTIVAVYDTGEDHVPGEGGAPQAVPFIVMEYVEGHTVRDILKGDVAAPIDEAVDIVSGVLTALDYSHNAGLVHRDIKPGNIMLTPTGAVKVMDFGIARAMADSGQTMTQTQAVVGTAQYLSPEQARGENVDHRSDLYSTGCVLFELLTGRPPFIGDSPVSVAYQHVREPAPRPSDFASDVPPELDRVVLRALTKDRTQRYSSALEFLADVRGAIGLGPVGTTTGAIPVGSAATGSGAAMVGAAAAVAGSTGDATEVIPVTTATTALPTLPGQAGMGAADTAPPWLRPNSADAPAAGSPWAPTGAAGAGAARAGAANAAPGTTRVRGEYVEDRVDWKRRGLYIAIAVIVGALAIWGLVTALSGGGTGPTNPSPSASITVPRLEGLSEAVASAQLDALNIPFEIAREPSEDVPAGEVIRTTPAEGSPLPEGTTLTVVVSSGIDAVIVPTVRAMPLAGAQAAIEDLDLVVGQIIEQDDDPIIGKGIVLETNPPAGDEVEPGTRIDIIVSSGFTNLPDLAGETEESARAALQELGLRPSFEDVQTTDKPEGTVIETSPGGLTRVPQGSTVIVRVAQVPATTVVPPVRGLTREDAEDAIRGANLTPVVQEVFYNGGVAAGLVISSNPGSGTTVPKGSSVTLVVSKGPEPGPTVTP